MSLEIFYKSILPIEFSKNSLGSIIDSHVHIFPEWEWSDIVFLSVNENRGCFSNKKNEIDHYSIRTKLYNFMWEGSLTISDLGILEAGSNLKDTYAALKEITFEIQKKRKLLVLLGGSQDLTFANYLGYERLAQPINITCIDHSFDVVVDEEQEISHKNYINHLLLHSPNNIFNFSILGCQQYYVGPDELRFFDELFFDYVRLGELQNAIFKSEPILRNTDLLSVDLSSLRNSEFKNSIYNHPNGFFGNEMCQMIKYAGLSDKVSSVGFYNLSSDEISEVDSELVAQLIFFLIVGFSQRKNDFPAGSKKELIKYSVYHEDTKHNLIFHKSKMTDRWWLEVPYPPVKDFKFERHHLIPCNYEDYKIAQNGVIPDLWWKTYRKLN